jgi:TolB-like protein
MVLPLANTTGDARLGRLADGLIKDVIADLPRSGVPAIAFGTSFSYRDKSSDPREVGRELFVRYVVEGSLQGDGQRLRAAVDLVDVATGEQVWSERYDRPLEEFFAVQDQLTEKIAGSAGGLSDATQRAYLEEARGKPSRNLQAYELWLLADEERRA